MDVAAGQTYMRGGLWLQGEKGPAQNQVLHVLTLPSKVRRMELTTKITSKGQVTIPVAVRRKLGVTGGERVAFVFRRPGEVVFRRAGIASVSSSGVLAGKTNGKVATSADIQCCLAEGAARRHHQ